MLSGLRGSPVLLMIRERRARASEYRLEDPVQRRAVMSSRHLIILILYIGRGSPLCRVRDYDAHRLFLFRRGVEVEETERTLLESRVSLIKKKKRKKKRKTKVQLGLFVPVASNRSV